MATKNEILNNSNEASHIDRNVKRLDAQINIPVTAKIPIKAEGVNGDIRIVNRNGKTYLYIKSNNNWSKRLFNKIEFKINKIDGTLFKYFHACKIFRSGKNWNIPKYYIKILPK